MPGGSSSRTRSSKSTGRKGDTSTNAGSSRKSGADPAPPKAIRREIQGQTTDDHRAWGRSVRDELARSTIADWSPASDRPDPVDLLLEQSSTRVPDLVPIRHGRMLVSPFTFYRGAALIMAADQARTPTSGIYVQACGDAHLSNFGTFATPERQLAFDVNDFDETHPAPFEWDLMRLAASIVIAADDIGLERPVGQGLARYAARRYREQIRDLSERYFLDVWYSHVDVESRREAAREAYSKAEMTSASKWIRKARRKTNVGALDRLAERVEGSWRIREEPPLIVRADLTPERVDRLRTFFHHYVESLPSDLMPLVQHYRPVDFARKVVGVGSVGTEAHIALLIGRRGDDPLFLQMKEAAASVLERYTVADPFRHQGQRVVLGQRLMQAVSDTFLGWATSPTSRRTSVDFYVRQLNDWKGSADVGSMDEHRLVTYVELCSEALARAHARSGSATAISGYLGKGKSFDRAMAVFAVAYADQNERDYEAFESAADAGRVETTYGM